MITKNSQISLSWLPKTIPDYFHVRHELSLMGDQDLLWDSQVEVPEAMQAEVLATGHKGNLGVVRMKQRCCTAEWWPGIDSHTEELFRNSESCLLSLLTISEPEYPWSLPCCHLGCGSPYS